MGGKRSKSRATTDACTEIEKLGDKEYKKLLQEIDQMSQTPVNMEELINKQMQRDSRKIGSGGTGNGSTRKMKNSKSRQTGNIEGIQDQCWRDDRVHGNEKRNRKRT